ncbi:MAG TPA: hypothetical protein VN133_10645 [Humibacter sp.]|nr:hypothetical protein [Humibacter sp.]
MAVFLAGVLVFAPGLLNFGVAAVQAAVNANWRGSYDIVAFADSSGVTTKDASGSTLLDSSYALTSSASIPNATVQKVSRLAGVEWAAPVGLLGRAAGWQQPVVLQIPASVLLQNPRLALRVYLSYTTDDGLSQRAMSPSNPINFLFDASHWDGHTDVQLTSNAQVPEGAQGISVSSYADGAGFTSGDYVYLFCGIAPRVPQSIIAVDPTAEAKLLGGNAQQPLRKLAAADQAVSAVAKQLGRLPTTDDVPAVQATQPQLSVSSSLTASFGKHAALAPMLEATDFVPAPLAMTARLTSLDMAKAGTAATGLLRAWRAPESPIGAVQVDVANQLTPLSSGSVHAAWPGTEWDAQSAAAHTFPPVAAYQGTAAGGLSLSRSTPPTGDRVHPSYRLQSLGAVDSGLPCASNCNASTPGWTQTYRPTKPAPLNLATSPAPGGGAPLRVGSFTSADFGVSKLASPSGAYDAAPVTLTAPAQGAAGAVGARLLPPLTGLGVPSPTVAGITTLAGAQALGVQDPFTAVRVRVSGVGDYGPKAIARIERVASELQNLGLQTYLVAGSSPEKVNVYVPDYVFGNVKTAQRVGDLGWVSTSMTALGVAQSSVSALQRLGTTTANVTVAVAIVAVPVLALIAAPRNRAANRVLRRNGYSRRRRRGWFWSQTLPTSLVVLAGAVIGTVLSPTTQAIARSGIAVGVVLVTAAIATVAYTISRSTTRVARGRARAYGSFRVTTLLILRNSATFTAIGVLAGAIACLLFVGLGAIQVVATRTSASQLGTLLTNTQLPTLVSSLVLAAASAGVLLVGVIAGRREAIRARTRTLRRDGGWRTSRVRALAIAESTVVAIVGVLATVIMFSLLLRAGAIPQATIDGLTLTEVALCLAIPLAPTITAHIRTATRRHDI